MGKRVIMPITTGWPTEIFDGLIASVPAEIEKQTRITSFSYIKAPKPNKKPHIYVEYGGCITETRDNSELLSKTMQQKALFCTIPIAIVLEYKGSGEIFAGKSLLYSAMAGQYLNNRIARVPISSVDFTKKDLVSGDDVEIKYTGFDINMNVQRSENGIHFKDDQDGDSWIFLQNWNATLTFRVSDSIGV